MARALAELLRSTGYRRLLTVRLLSQCGDGVLQAALAGLFFFSPERQSTTGDIASAFAVLLLPYSVVGPFTGVLLDRWRRRQVLLYANLLRAVLVGVVLALVVAGAPLAAIEVAVLVALAVNRFLLSALSAGLPHVVPLGPAGSQQSAAALVSANSVTPTLGSCAFLVGLAVGGAVRGLTASDPPALVLTIAGYLVAGASALRLGRDSLGPQRLTSGSGEGASVAHPANDDRPRLQDVLPGLRAAGRHLLERRPAGLALAAMAASRAGYGAALLAAIATLRADAATPQAAMSDLAVVLGASGGGFVVAALLAPPIAPRVGAGRWLTGCLVLAAVAVAGIALHDGLPALVAAAVILGFALQGVKIATDTLVQHDVDDEFRGRVFSLYDVLYNASFVAAAVLWAVVWPTGRTPELGWLLIAAGFALDAALHSAGSRRRTLVLPPEQPPTVSLTDADGARSGAR